MTCKAKLYIADDYGDNSATINCQLAEGHEGLHKEVFNRKGTDVTITWEIDESDYDERGEYYEDYYDEDDD